MASRDMFQVSPAHQPVFRELGLDAEGMFSDPRVVVWRSIRERENCTLDADLVDGRHIRWHLKRHKSIVRGATPADEEARGIQLLEQRGIATTPLVGWGRLADGRSLIVTEDLVGFGPADKLIARGAASFESLLEPTAVLAATLHEVGLHHRDLYLCHFFAKVDGGRVELRLIDAARVKPLPRWLAYRWVVKDLAQFWYSTLALDVSDAQRERWLARYAGQRAIKSVDGLRRSVVRKSDAIGRHDRRLVRRQPGRNVSIPEV